MIKHQIMQLISQVEVLYSLIVVFLCFLVYYKTKEIYNLTKYKGIGYFRISFLLFGFAYLTRLIVFLTQISLSFFNLFLHKPFINLIFLVSTSYLSTLAIFFLGYSTLWKKIKYQYFIWISQIISILICLIALINRSPLLISIIQLPLIIIAIILNLKKKNKKNKHYTKILYFLFLIFWLINFLTLSRGFRIKILLILVQIISIIILILIYLKVLKCTK